MYLNIYVYLNVYVFSKMQRKLVKTKLFIVNKEETNTYFKDKCRKNEDVMKFYVIIFLTIEFFSFPQKIGRKFRSITKIFIKLSDNNEII